MCSWNHACVLQGNSLHSSQHMINHYLMINREFEAHPCSITYQCACAEHAHCTHSIEYGIAWPYISSASGRQQTQFRADPTRIIALCLHTCTSGNKQTNTVTQTHKHKHTYVCMHHTYMYAYERIRTHACTHIEVYKRAHTRTHTSIHTHTHIYIYI